MKKTLVSLYALSICFGAFAQKTIDLEVQIIPSMKEVPNGSTITFDYVFINHGPDDFLKGEDTFVFYLPHLGDQTRGMIGITYDIFSGTSDTIYQDPQLGMKNGFDQDTLLPFCIELVDMSTVTDRGRPVAVTYIDPNPANNIACTPEILMKGKGSTYVSAVDWERELLAYPNPVQDRLFLRTKGISESGLRYVLSTAEGRIIQGGSLTQLMDVGADVSMLPAGIYYLKVNTKGGSYVQKVVKY